MFPSVFQMTRCCDGFATGEAAYIPAKLGCEMVSHHWISGCATIIGTRVIRLCARPSASARSPKEKDGAPPVQPTHLGSRAMCRALPPRCFKYSVLWPSTLPTCCVLKKTQCFTVFLGRTFRCFVRSFIPPCVLRCFVTPQLLSTFASMLPPHSPSLTPNGPNTVPQLCIL